MRSRPPASRAEGKEKEKEKGETRRKARGDRRRRRTAACTVRRDWHITGATRPMLLVFAQPQKRNLASRLRAAGSSLSLSPSLCAGPACRPAGDRGDSRWMGGERWPRRRRGGRWKRRNNGAVLCAPCSESCEHLRENWPACCARAKCGQLAVTRTLDTTMTRLSRAPLFANSLDAASNWLPSANGRHIREVCKCKLELRQKDLKATLWRPRADGRKAKCD